MRTKNCTSLLMVLVLPVTWELLTSRYTTPLVMA